MTRKKQKLVFIEPSILPNNKKPNRGNSVLAMSLARVWQQQGKRPEAHQMLSGIYNWFTEGFDTKDLQEAKALLQELA